EGYLLVPGSTLKGIVRERCEQIAHLFGLPTRSPHDETSAALVAYRQKSELISNLFGSRTQPGTLFFDDALLTTDCREFFNHDSDVLKAKYRAWQAETRTQVCLSRSTRTARSGQLFTSEYGSAGLTFEGGV